MGQKRWKNWGIRKVEGGGRMKNLCARQRHDEKSLNNFSFTIFQPNKFRVEFVRLNLNINRARCWDLYQAAVSVCLDSYIYLYLYLDMHLYLRRYYELLWESAGLSCGIGSLHVCLQFSRATIFAVEFFTQRFPFSVAFLQIGGKLESVSAREMLLLFMYFDKIPRAHSLPDNLVLSTRQHLLANEYG